MWNIGPILVKAMEASATRTIFSKSCLPYYTLVYHFWLPLMFKVCTLHSSHITKLVTSTILSIWLNQFCLSFNIFRHFMLKLVSAIFYQVFISHQMIVLQKLWKMLFISSKTLFSLSRYSHFCISRLLSFFPCQPLL